MPVAPAAIAQAIACMVSGRIPISCAAVESSATASIFDPSEVRVSKRCRPSVTNSAGQQPRGLDPQAPYIEGAADDIFRQSQEIGAEPPEHGIAQQQGEPESAEYLGQHRPLH